LFLVKRFVDSCIETYSSPKLATCCHVVHDDMDAKGSLLGVLNYHQIYVSQDNILDGGDKDQSKPAQTSHDKNSQTASERTTLTEEIPCECSSV